jgi:hypothetical protein
MKKGSDSLLQGLDVQERLLLVEEGEAVDLVHASVRVNEVQGS